jgi:hypothetical protein
MTSLQFLPIPKFIEEQRLTLLRLNTGCGHSLAFAVADGHLAQQLNIKKAGQLTRPLDELRKRLRLGRHRYVLIDHF